MPFLIFPKNKTLLKVGIIFVCLLVVLHFTLQAQSLSCPENSQACQAQKEAGIDFLGSPVKPLLAVQALAQSTSVTEPGALCRYSDRLQIWKDMEENKAYYRDIWVGQQMYIYDAVDGDNWYGESILPNGTNRQWATLRFYSYYNGETDCFVSSSQKMCGTKNAILRWYTSAQCTPTGTWEFKFYKNSTPLFSQEFTLLPQLPPYPGENVPLYAQRNYPEDKYDHTDHSIAVKGCALTSAAMVLSYHGFNVNPKELNDYLIANDGYGKRGDLKWERALDGYSQGKIKYLGRVDKYFGLFPLPGIDDQLEKDICQYGPQVLRLNYAIGRNHFTPVTGRDDDKTTWLIADSYDGTNAEITKWGGDYKDYRKCDGPTHAYIDSRCGITIFLHSPAELLLTDPLGRKAGYDPVTNTFYYDQIPYAGYGEEGLPSLPEDPPEPQGRGLDIAVAPAEGEYELKVIGTGEGAYDLEIYAWDREGGESSRIFENVPIAPNVTHTYILNYSREAGSQIETTGAFDGKGQRPRDVNKFLSYSSPMDVTTELISGQTTFDVFILYDRNILPQTFTATLNRQDITGLFSPSVGGAELVRLNLDKGRNTLTLSVDGILSSGRQATDTDRLVFIVP